MNLTTLTARILLAIFLPLVLMESALGEPRIGVYSGTFDPPHNGHAQVIRLALEQGKLDRVIVVCNPDTPHKPDASEFKHRRTMAELAFGSIPGVIMADEGIYQNFDRSNFGTTVEYLKGRSGGSGEIAGPASYFQIMGADSYERAFEGPFPPTEDRFIIVVPRKGMNLRPARPQDTVLKMEDPGYSSTQVRKGFAEGKPPSWIAPEVVDYIRTHSLYGPCDGPLRRLNQTGLLRKPEARYAQIGFSAMFGKACGAIGLSSAARTHGFWQPG